MRVPIAGLVVLSVIASASAQDPKPLATDDLVEVQVLHLTAPNHTVRLLERVDPKGQIYLPLAGTLDVKGLTLDQAAKRVDAIYFEKNLVRQMNAKLLLVESAATASVKSGPVAAGDQVRIRVWDLQGPGEETAWQNKVGEDGTFAMPQIGSLKIAGMTEAEVETAVQKALRDKQLLKSAIVECLRISAAPAGAAK